MDEEVPHTPQQAIDEETRRRTIDGIVRCLHTLMAGIGRDYERCGKAACARSRRCRGVACMPDGET